MTNIRLLSSLAAAALIASSAQAEQVALVNFGNTAYTSDGVNTWQNFDLNGAGTTFVNVPSTALLDKTGAASGLTITITGTNPAAFNSISDASVATQAKFDAPTSGTKPSWFDSSSAQQRDGFKFFAYDVTYTISGFSASDTVQFDYVVGSAALGGGATRNLTLTRPAGPTTLLNAVSFINESVYYATLPGLTGATSYSFLAKATGTSTAALVNALAVTRGVDATKPTLTGTNPADDATGVPTTTNLVATFSEPVLAGTGNIELRKTSGGTLVESFDVTTSSRITFSGSTLTIDPTSNLNLGVEYYLLIPATAVKDTSNNFYDGISATTAWSFTTVTSLFAHHYTFDSNANDSAGSSNGTLVGDAFVNTGGSNPVGGGYLDLDGTGDWVSLGSSILTPAGSTSTQPVTLSGWVRFDANVNAVLYSEFGGTSNYRYTFGTNALGNKISLDQFPQSSSNYLEANAGLSDGQWHHVAYTQDPGATTKRRLFLDGIQLAVAQGSATAIETYTGTTPPTALIGARGDQLVPINGAVDDMAFWHGPLTVGDMKGLYDVAMEATLGYDAGQFNQLKQIHDAGSGSVTIGGLVWTHATGLGSTAGLSGTTPTFALVLDGSVGTGLTSNSSGPDTTKPTLTGTNPADDATHVLPTTGLVASFSEPVLAGAGSIELRKTGGVLVESFDVTTAPSAQLTIAGTQVTLNPASDLEPGVNYYVLIPATAIKDSSDNFYNGISATTAWSFTTTATDYQTWALLYPGTDLTDPNEDHDADGLSNDAERLFGLDPTSGSSVNPISVPINRTTGTFSYTRRDDALTGLAYSAWYSLDLDNWFEDYSAVQIPGTPDANGVETVAVTITPALLAEPKLFVRVQAGQPQTRALVFLIGGQSNAGGVASLYASDNPLYNTAYGIPTTPDSTAEEVGIPLTAEGYPRSAIWKGASWVDLIPGSGYYTSPYPGDPNRHGIELPMAKLLEAAYPQHDKFFIKHGPGGHNLYSQWKANTGPDYITFINYYNAAMADLTARYDVVEVVGLYWDQGESDEPQAAAYKQNLQDLIAALRTDTGIPDLPIFVRKHLFQHGNTAFAPIITAQVEVTNDDSHAHLLDLDLGTNEANFLEWAWIYGNGHLSSKAFLELSNRILVIPNP